jgi:hypothetical protein
MTTPMKRKTGAERRFSGKRAVLLGGALILLVYLGGNALSRRITAPWSVGQVGRETLIGPWAGSLRAQRGAGYGLWPDLQHRSRAAFGATCRRIRA